MDKIALGDIAEDSITGFRGVVIARTEWLYGCNRLTLQPKALREGKPIDTQTFDEPQLIFIEAGPRHADNVIQIGGGPRPEPERHNL